MFRAGIITVSDRSYAGERVDESGPAVMACLDASVYEVAETAVVPDEADLIKDKLLELCDKKNCDIIFTTGGTGFSPRDITPEVTEDVGERNVPGVAEAMRMCSMKYTPKAMLSRGVCVIRGRTLIVNLPGSPKAVKECLEYILEPLGHGLDILKGYGTD